MKNDILHYYGLDAQELLESDFGYQFYIDYDKYILYRTSRSDSLMTEVDTFLSKTPNKYYRIIPAIDGKRVCKIENVSYVLLKVTTPLNEEISADTIMANSIPVFNSLSSLDRSNWAFLWESKVDYLEYQVLELAGDYSIVKSTFNYYVGLSENAIEYYRAINRENTHLVLSQKRIYCPNIAKNYYNPATLVVDYRVRSLAEYIKSYFFNGDNTKEADRLIHKDFGLSNSEYNLLFARLLYPSYYFDEITNIIEYKKNEDNILKYIEKATDYEKFLKKCLEEFSKHTNMIKVDWLL